MAPYGSFVMESVGTEYIGAIQRVGGVPILLPHGEPEDADQLLRHVDGLVLIGGDDVDPSTYGQSNEGLSRGTDVAADAFEIALAKTARARDIPTLAVCRGMQILNVALGGSLHQDLESDLAHRAPTGDGTTLPVAHHDVRIHDSTCFLAQLYDSVFGVNSIHHQSLARVADGLRVVATAEDGTVESVEAAVSSWPLIGVQWHPEKMETGAPLFQWLVERATQFHLERPDAQRQTDR